jgi:hypothetical protein
MAAHRDPERLKKTRTRSSTVFLQRKQSKSGSTSEHYYEVLGNFYEISRDAIESFAVTPVDLIAALQTLLSKS